jgi:hypothetical protein
MKIDVILNDIFLKGENDSAFWILSNGARIPGISGEVINLLWTMRRP